MVTLLVRYANLLCCQMFQFTFNQELCPVSKPSPLRFGLAYAMIGVVIPDSLAPSPDPGVQPILRNICCPLLPTEIGSVFSPT